MQAVKYPLFFLLAFTLVGCSSALPDYKQMPSYVKQHDETSRLAEASRLVLTDVPKDQSSVHPLGDGIAAFIARIALIKSADSTLDVQYYIYRSDETGGIITAALMEAAERGVRVRLLVDDMPNSGNDEAVKLLDAHPNVEIRLFNPFVNRRFRGLEAASSFSRINRRMHNKSLTADNLATVVGGRNIGDEYFAADAQLEFGDFDLLAFGAVVPEVSGQFDLYWNSPFSVSVNELIPGEVSVEMMEKAKSAFFKELSNLEERDYVVRLKESKMLRDLEAGELQWFTGRARVVYDLPDKVGKPINAKESFIVRDMGSVFSGLESQAILISPYFVPMDEGVKNLVAMVDRGVEVSVVTNSLAATDVVAVHSGYRKYRKDLLAGGVKIYESKVNPSHKPSSWKGSSRASLHAKSFVLDERKVFVGSFNIDPRSVELNTEMGILIESPELAKAILSGEDQLAGTTYRLVLDEGTRDIVWIDDVTGRHYESEPDASLWRRIGAVLIGWLPIENQL